MKRRFGNAWAYVIGSGVALSPIHNQWLTDLATNDNGETYFFLPALGYLLLIMGTGLFLLYHWNGIKRTIFRDRRVCAPLLVIVVAIGISGVCNGDGLEDSIAPLGMGLALFGVYVASRALGKAVFLPLAVGAAVASIGIILHGVIFRSGITGGFIFENNYDIAVGYVMFGAVLFSYQRQWILVGLSLIAMFLTGSPEGIFASSALILIILYRRDHSWKLAAVGGVLIAIIALWFGLGYGQGLHGYAFRVATMEGTMPPPEVVAQERSETRLPTPASGPDAVNLQNAISYRWGVIEHELSSLKPFGIGYSVTEFNTYTVHNVPLVIVQQLGWLGILAALAWLWVSFYCLIKTRWRYAWVLMLVLGVFDHYTWTQIAPVWWMLVGVSLADTDASDDRIFKSATPRPITPASATSDSRDARERLERMRRLLSR